MGGNPAEGGSWWRRNKTPTLWTAAIGVVGVGGLGAVLSLGGEGASGGGGRNDELPDAPLPVVVFESDQVKIEAVGTGVDFIVTRNNSDLKNSLNNVLRGVNEIRRRCGEVEIAISDDYYKAVVSVSPDKAGCWDQPIPIAPLATATS